MLMALLGIFSTFFPLKDWLLKRKNMLGEMHFIASSDDSWSNLPRSDGVAYVAQESWVQNETIHQNILFGLPYDETRYRKGRYRQFISFCCYNYVFCTVIKQCALERDLELFEAGDATEVGEKGLTLRFVIPNEIWFITFTIYFFLIAVVKR